MGRKMTMVMVLTVVVVAAITTATPAKGQTAVGDLPCIPSLIPCIGYIEDPNPPASCCLPLKEAFQTQQKCLCTIFNNPNLLAATGNVTEALKLPNKCGIDVDTSVCNKLLAQAPASIPEISVPAESTPGESGAIKIGAVSGLVMLVVALFMLI